MTKRVLVAMSGGVDSSVTAALLLQQGLEVEGVTLKLTAGLCCDIGSAQAVCNSLVELWGRSFSECIAAGLNIGQFQQLSR